jgi:hypothetical protein
MSTRYWMIVKRTDGKFARVFGKTFNDPDYLGACVLVEYPDQAAAEAGLQKNRPENFYKGNIEVFDTLQSAWVYEYAIDHISFGRMANGSMAAPRMAPRAFTR